jgi:hypothetical protein
MSRLIVRPMLVATVLAVGISSGLAWAQGVPGPTSTKNSSVGRTPWDDPDLQGTYSNSNESGIPMQRPAELAGKTLKDVTPAELEKLMQQRHAQTERTAIVIGGTADNDTGAGPSHWYENYNAKNSRAWMISDPPDGQMPALTPEAVKRATAVRAARRGGDGYYNGPFDGPEDLTLYVRCITRGLPGSMMPAIYGNAYEIIQGPATVAIRYEMIHETRVIPLDGRPHAGKGVQLDMGDGRGRWEGDTLVVETTNFTPRSSYRNANAKAFRLIERFTPVAPNLLEWSVTVDDPTTWTRQWTFAMNLTKGGPDKQPFEYACHEGNYGMENMLSAARKAEREAEKKP